MKIGFFLAAIVAAWCVAFVLQADSPALLEVGSFSTAAAGHALPEGWKPPTRRPGWPQTGGIPDIALPENLLALLKPPGRPRKR